MTGRRLAPLLANLALASVARIAVPSTLAPGGERYVYYTMSLLFPLAKCPTFHCFRFGAPLLASLWPLQVIDAFLVTGFVCQVLAGTLLWHMAERRGRARRAAFVCAVWFWATWAALPTFRDP